MWFVLKLLVPQLGIVEDLSNRDRTGKRAAVLQRVKVVEWNNEKTG